MCVLFIAWQMHPDYPLIIAANRDEYFERSTAPLAPWADEPLLAGRDLAAGGTWFGLGQGGQVAGLTNIRRPDLIQPHKRSRGELVVRYLAGIEESAFQTWLSIEAQHYNPFNLLFGSLNQLWTFNSLSRQIEPLQAGFHSISNGALDDIWPKMARGTQAMQRHITSDEHLTAASLLDLLRDTELAPYEQLPQTGVAAEYEYLLSSIFISPATFPQGLYGTRSSTVLMYSHTHYQLIEQSYNEQGKVIHSIQFTNPISSII